jgi:hypothetical protein
MREDDRGAEAARGGRRLDQQSARAGLRVDGVKNAGHATRAVVEGDDHAASDQPGDRRLIESHRHVDTQLRSRLNFFADTNSPATPSWILPVQVR